MFDAGLKQVSADLIARASTVAEVSTPTQALSVQAIRDVLLRMIGSLEDARIREKAPHLAAGRNVDDKYQLEIKRLTAAKVTLNGMLTQYAAECSRKLAEAEARAVLSRAETDVIAPITADVISAHAATGLVSTRATQSLEIMDAALIPREYLVPDMALIRAALLRGTQVPGARMVTERKAV